MNVLLRPVCINPAWLIGRFWVLLLACLVMSNATAAGNDPFIFEIKQEPKTIGDIKPSFLVYKDQQLPKISIEYVLKRYIKLFETADSPDVKVDALNRINNLAAKYGLTSKKLTIDKVKQSQVVLDSYDRIVDSGVFYQRMDELLYQTAKATRFIGNPEESIKRLKLLVGLYPRSKLFDESMFRMAEAYFELGDYAKAEAQYKKVLTFSQTDTFHHRARFKLGWSAFRLNRFEEAGKTAFETLDHYPGLSKAIDFTRVNEPDRDLVEDTLRLLAIVFSKQNGAETIEQLQALVGHQDYAFLLYDALFRFYLNQDRFEDGALIASAFSRQYPAHSQSYVMAINTIKSYRRGEFDIKEWTAKEDFVASFGIDSHYWSQLDGSQVAAVKPYLTKYLGELAHLYYIRMQQGLDAKSEHYAELGKRAAAYYLELSAARPAYVENGQYFYLAGQALAVASEYQAAIEAYEQAAYMQTEHAASSKAGYAAILAYDKIKQQTGALSQSLVLARRESIQRYAEYFADDKRTAALLNDLANELLVAKRYVDAESTSSKVVAYRQADPNILYSSWLVNAHANFELKHFVKAEQGYQRALAFNKLKDKSALDERLAASIYKQAELETDIEKSAALFLKVVDAAPESSIVPMALYDASSQQLSIKNWKGAIASLNYFQSAFPNHALYDEASDKLIYAYTHNGENVSAAEKLVEVATRSKDREKAANALFRAAELYQHNGFGFESVKLFERFSKNYENSFDLNLEARYQTVNHYRNENNVKAADQSRMALIDYENKYQNKRTDRSAFLAATASFELAMRQFDNFKQARLTLPLKQSLKRKKTLLNKTVSKLEAVARYQVAELVSASTYQIAEVYRLLADDLMNSERPPSLDELQLEQYDILLEEQAYPFEEQAMDIFRINLEKVASGEFDQWLRKTYQRLEVMNPTEYKRESKTISYASQIY